MILKNEENKAMENTGTVTPTPVHDTVKPVYNDHLMGYFSAFLGLI